MTNMELRFFMREKGVHQYEVAQKMGISQSLLSRRMHTEMDDSDKKKIEEIVKEIARKRRGRRK